MQMFALESNGVGAGNTFNHLPQNNSYPSHDLLGEIREFDRVNSVQINTSSCLGSQEIRNLGLDSGSYDQMITSIFEHMDKYHCEPMTKYLAKIYIDHYLKINSKTRFEAYSLLAVTAMLLAIKFNESFTYSPELISSHQNFGHSVQDIINFEMTLLMALDYRLKFATPFCYLSKIKTLLGNQNQVNYEEIESLIQLSALDLELVNYSSSQIFLACLICFARMNSTEGQIPLVNQIFSFSSNLPGIVQIIQNTLNAYEEEQPQNSVQFEHN